MKIFINALIMSLLLSIAGFGQHATMITTKGDSSKVNIIRSGKDFFKVKYMSTPDRSTHLVPHAAIERMIYPEGTFVIFNTTEVQRVLLLTHQGDKSKTLVFREGIRVKFKEKDAEKWQEGIIDQINKDSLSIGGHEIALEDLASIYGRPTAAQKRKNLGLGMITTGLFWVLGAVVENGNTFALAAPIMSVIGLLTIASGAKRKYHLYKNWTPSIVVKN